MHRREYLGAVAAATLAGCTGMPAAGGSDGGSGDETTTDQSTTDERTTDERTTTDESSFPYSLTNVQTAGPPVADATMDATVTRYFRRDHPPRLRVSFTNEADEAREFTFGSLVPWDTIRGSREKGDATLLLSPTESVVPDNPHEDCWRATDGVALPAVMRSATLDPGETVSSEFTVLAAHDSEQCHPAGTYRFENPNYLDDGWWFTVDVVRTVQQGGDY